MKNNNIAIKEKMRKAMFAFGLVVLLASSQVLASKGPAQPCVQAQCHLPDCRCSSTDVPGGFSSSEVPQVSHFNPTLVKNFIKL